MELKSALKASTERPGSILGPPGISYARELGSEKRAGSPPDAFIKAQVSPKAPSGASYSVPLPRASVLGKRTIGKKIHAGIIYGV